MLRVGVQGLCRSGVPGQKMLGLGQGDLRKRLSDTEWVNALDEEYHPCQCLSFFWFWLPACLEFRICSLKASPASYEDASWHGQKSSLKKQSLGAALPSISQERDTEKLPGGGMQRDCHVSPGADLFPGFQAGNAEEVCSRYCFMLCWKPSRGLEFLWAPWFREAVNTVWTCTKKEVKEKWLINNAECFSLGMGDMEMKMTMPSY